ncbi:MAG: ShlB/FhaC/HecB family hemolysin secretion/activation protein [Myxococcales bacterium]|nr:ShlB/FhaC/HecB family hemolysin secretion/activation protein [Myxococcales bacterium]
MDSSVAWSQAELQTGPEPVIDPAAVETAAGEAATPDNAFAESTAEEVDTSETDGVEGETGDANELVVESPETESLEVVTYHVTRFQLDYLNETPNAPSISFLRRTRIKLGMMELIEWEGNVFVAPEKSEAQVDFRLDEIPADSPTHFTAAALASINRQIVKAVSHEGLGSIIVAPDGEDIGFTTGQDLRAEGNTTLRLTIFLPTIKELQSFATGERIPEVDATNNRAHSRILRESPVQAGELFWPSEVDDYVARLNRHPGRRVIAQLSPSNDKQQLYLDYQITESKPWITYGSISNTGGEQTGRTQARVGFVDLQLTNRDDIFALDYVMNTNGNVRATNGIYQLPLWIDTVRMEVAGSYADYEGTAGEFQSPTDIDGKQARGELNLVYNFFQFEEYFLDVMGGATYEYIETKTKTSGLVTGGTENFLIARLGLRLERKNPKLKLRASTWVDFGTLNHDDSDPMSDFNNLVRLLPDDNPVVLRWDAKLAFFIDGLLADPKNPSPTLAHEFVIRYRGQSTFDKYRLQSHALQIAGGMETVRGYEQGVTAGDSVHLGSLEYRYHVPRIFKPRPATTVFPLIGEFAIAPRGPGERPDWDWVLKVFYDVASIRQTDRQVAEFNDTLQSVGVGTELFIKRNVQLRLDWGIALEDAHCTPLGGGGSLCTIKKHESEINFLASIFY